MGDNAQQSLFAAERARPTFGSRIAEYDAKNLATARYVLAHYADRPDYRCVVAWARLVIDRLAPAEGQVAA